MSLRRIARIQRVLGFLALFAPSLVTTSPAYAQPSPTDLKRARAQFQRAIELEQASNWTEAIQEFREVGQVRMTPQVRFHIAYCEENLGRLVTALGGYDLALSEADTVGSDFKSEVETAMSRLREKIPKLLIERGTGADAALVQLDGVDLGASQIGVEVPLDPGPHTVTANAPGFIPFSATADLKEREVTKVTIELEIAPEPTTPPPPTRVVVVPRDEGPSRTVPYIIGGAGILFLGAGGALWALRQSTLADLEQDCPIRDECAKSNEASYERVKVYGIASPVAAGVGVAAIGTAVALIIFEKKPEKKPAKSKKGALSVDFVVPTATPDGSFAGAIFGRF
jgi:hypothetical protein